MPHTHFCFECDHDVEAGHKHDSLRYDPAVASIDEIAARARPGCPGLPECRWLAGLLPYEGPFVTDHAGWHEAGSHATIYRPDGPVCACGAGTYVGDNDGSFPHLTENAVVVVCAATGRRIGYYGETVDPFRPGSEVERSARVEVRLTPCDLDVIAVAADDSGMAVDEWIREAALRLASYNGPTVEAIRD